MSQQAHSGKPLDPSPILALSTAYWDAQTLLTANRMGLFGLLSSEALTLQQIADGLNSQPQACRLLLNACIALQLVSEQDGLYACSELSRAFLAPGSPAYLGDAIRYSDDLYQTWGKLQQALETGQPQMPAQQYTGENEQQTRHFVYGMHNRALGVGRVLVDLLNLEGRRQMIDVGGGPGTYSSLLAQRYPKLHSTVLDLPSVVEIADEIIDSMKMSERVKTRPLDYHHEDFPTGNDVVLISGVFHRETEETCRGFIERARDALEPGGMLVISDIFTDANSQGPRFATLFGLNMMLTAEQGTVHADAAVVNWMEQAGFGQLHRREFPPPMPHRVVYGVKQ